CVIDELVHIALYRPVAARRVCIETTACLHCKVGRLLHRLDGEIAGRLHDDRSLAADPRDNGWPVLVIIATPGLAFLTTTTWLASQRLLPAPFCLPLVADGVIEIIGFHRPFQLAMHLVGQRGIAEPPAPAIARLDVDAHFSGNAP